MSVHSIVEILQKKKIKEEERSLDIAASYVLIKQCYDYLAMNKLEDIEYLKEEMVKAMKKLRKKGNGRKN